ncbi:hypothetical protein [Achromobacter marplatensis]|uniref:Uncharacterized protein n=1 Tax=Achromobacter marplatensis TaxID=470868 RepID=A0AA42WFM5_9BURK|nr:hypothetical protein [Achromobacter marplatensis]MDH2052719.1 hypothetical protein [Achromobacter marplatensis]
MTGDISNVGGRPAAVDKKLQQVLYQELGSAAADFLLIPRDGPSLPRLSFNLPAVMAYCSAYCAQSAGNDCPDGSFPLDCTHFVAHSLSKSKILVNLPTAVCANGVCVRVAELAAAFLNSTGSYTNVKRINELSDSRAGDFCFVVSWFGVAKDHVMILADTISGARGRVYGHTNNRCGELVDLTEQDLVIYRIE